MDSFPNLAAGDVLVFDRAPRSRGPEFLRDADPAHRHAVRLTERSLLNDEVAGNLAVTEIAWFDEDALPFPLCISSDVFDDVSVALGNIVLADHGLTQADLPADGSIAPKDAASSLDPETDLTRTRR